MKVPDMSWMITQIFLSDTGVHEVHIHNDTHKLRCNCSGYNTRTNCKHTRFVKDKMEKNDGIYPVEISNKVDRYESHLASEDPIAFRELLVNFGKIVAL